MAEHDELPELNQKWFDKRFSAIRGPNVRQAEVELRCLIREVHVALRFREVKAEARRRTDAQRGVSAPSSKARLAAVEQS
jgi:hypothetical protein